MMLQEFLEVSRDGFSADHQSRLDVEMDQMAVLRERRRLDYYSGLMEKDISDETSLSWSLDVHAPVYFVYSFLRNTYLPS